MVGARRAIASRAQVRHRHVDSEDGSLILDILIGMAIFALIAIIAISAVGQYRMRAYIQTAMSDAEATAQAMSAAFTELSTEEDFAGLPNGDLTSDELSAVGVTPTGAGGANESLISLFPHDAEHFEVCVEYRGAVAIYDSESGLADSGTVEDVGYGCHLETVEETDEIPPAPTCAPKMYYVFPLVYRAGLMDVIPRVDEMGLEEGQYFMPNQIPGMTREAWTDWNAPWAFYHGINWWPEPGVRIDAWGVVTDPETGLSTVVDADKNPVDVPSMGEAALVVDADGKTWMFATPIEPVWSPGFRNSGGWYYPGQWVCHNTD